MPECPLEGQLGQCGPFQTASQDPGRQQDQRGQGQDHKGGDEYAEHGRNPLLLRMFYFGLGMGVGCGTKSRLVGEKSPGHTVANGLPQSQAGRAARHRLRLEGPHKNGAHRLRQRGPVEYQNGRAPSHIDPRHQRHQLFGHRGHPAYSTQKNERGDGGHPDPHRQRRNAEGMLKGTRNGVGLHHIAHDSQRQNQKHRKDPSTDPSGRNER